MSLRDALKWNLGWFKRYTTLRRIQPLLRPDPEPSNSDCPIPEYISLEAHNEILKKYISNVKNNLKDMISASKKGLNFDWEDHIHYFIDNKLKGGY